MFLELADRYLSVPGSEDCGTCLQVPFLLLHHLHTDRQRRITSRSLSIPCLIMQSIRRLLRIKTTPVQLSFEKMVAGPHRFVEQTQIFSRLAIVNPPTPDKFAFLFK